MKFLEVGLGSFNYPVVVNLKELVSVSSDTMEILEIRVRCFSTYNPGISEKSFFRFKYPTRSLLDNEYYRIKQALLLD
jgi:hypothetical protein